MKKFEDLYWEELAELATKDGLLSHEESKKFLNEILWISSHIQDGKR